MLSTKNLVDDFKSVPSTWVFEHYCQLTEALVGQDVKIPSIFKEEKTPSMCIYLDARLNKYRFKDFSSGKYGDAVSLVMNMYNIDFHHAALRIVADYNDAVLYNRVGLQGEIKRKSKYRVSSYETRGWTKTDAAFWVPYNIGSSLLEAYNVRPIKQYTMLKEEGGVVENSFTVSSDSVYGYFTKAGDLYKIYQPLNRERKFTNVMNHIQGSEQLSGDKQTLIITSSLKDLLSLKSLGLQVDSMAPTSENSFIGYEQLRAFSERYKRVATLFDNDPAGIEAMKHYRDTYGITPILLPLSKDLSDSIRDHGKDRVIVELVPMIGKLPELQFIEQTVTCKGVHL